MEETMQVIYEGSSSTGVVLAATGQLVEPGVPVDVPDDVGVSLLEQDGWKPAKKSKSAETAAAGEV